MLSRIEFREIFYMMTSPCVVLLPEGADYRIVEVNEAYLEALRMTREELIQRPLSDVFSPTQRRGWNDYKDLVQSLDTVMKSGEPHHMGIQTYSIPSPGGELPVTKKWSPRNLPVRNEDGEVALILHMVSDVTSKVRQEEFKASEKRAKKALKESNEQLARILESITVGFVSVSPSWEITYWNKEAESLLDKKHEEVFGKNLWEIYPPNLVPRVYEALQKVMKASSPQTMHHYFLPHKAWYKLTAYHTGEGLSILFEDITDQKKTEKAKESALRNLRERVKEQTCLYKITNLKEQEFSVEELLAQAVNLIPDGFHQPELTTAEIVLGDKYFYSDNVPAASVNQIPTIIAEEQTDLASLKLNIYFHGEVAPLKLGLLDEEVQLLKSITHNLAMKVNQIVSKQELETSREELQRIMDQSMDVICTIDKKGRFVNVGAACKKVWGYAPEELIGRELLDLVHEEDVDHTLNALRRVQRGKQIITIENRCQRASGKTVSMEWSARRGNGGRRIYCVARDVTPKKQAEAEREELIRELTRNNNDLRQFSYITSHNLRSPISNLQNLIYLLENSSLNAQEVQEILNDFKESTRLLSQTIDDLTRILVIRDKSSIEQEDIDLQRVFDQTMHQMDHLVKAHHPEITSDFEDAPVVHFNRTYLDSIFQNLLTNSFKFRSPDRKLKIHVESRDIGDHILMTFQDNGIGMDITRHRDRIFGLYQRFHEHSGGKGIGLYLIRSQVEALGGSIGLESEVDKGMSVLLRFKKKEATPHSLVQDDTAHHPSDL